METEVSYRPGALFLAQAHPPSSSQWALTGERMTIGRNPASEICLTDARISWHHADLLRHGYSWTIADAQSTNGTFVNGERVREVMLRPHDRIRLGEIEIVLRELNPGRGGGQTVPPGGYQPGPPASYQGAVSYDVGWQQGNINNV